MVGKVESVEYSIFRNNASSEAGLINEIVFVFIAWVSSDSFWSIIFVLICLIFSALLYVNLTSNILSTEISLIVIMFFAKITFSGVVPTNSLVKSFKNNGSSFNVPLYVNINAVSVSFNVYDSRSINNVNKFKLMTFVSFTPWDVTTNVSLSEEKSKVIVFVDLFILLWEPVILYSSAVNSLEVLFE